MSTNSKSILVAGLGRYGPTASASTNQDKVHKDLANAREHCFDCDFLEANPDDVAGTLNAVKEKLRSKHWDGFVIGYGIRGLKEYTVLFEDIVNAAREITPTTKLLFSMAPDGVFQGIQRAFTESANG